MAKAQPNQQCPGCSGNRMVESTKTGAVQTCPLCQGSGKMEPAYNRVPRWYPWNNASSIVLAASAGGGIAGADSNVQLLITGDQDFECLALIADSNPGANPGPWADQIWDQASAWQDNLVYVNSDNRWGTAQRPLYLPAPIIIPSRWYMQGRFHDLSGATNTIQPCFFGYDLYPIDSGS